MKALPRFIIALVLPLFSGLFLPSCTVHKKINERGYGIRWHKHDITSQSSITATSNIPNSGQHTEKNIVCQQDNQLNFHDATRIQLHAGNIPIEDLQKPRSIRTKTNKKNTNLLLDKPVIATLNTAFHEDKSRIQTEEPKILPMAIISLVLSILLPPVGFVLGIISYKKIKKNPNLYTGEKLSLVSITISACLLIPIIGILLLILIFSGGGGGGGYWI
jgi:uncharacterized membrane protein